MAMGVIIQEDRGEFVNANGFNAWRGFDERGDEIGFLDRDAMASDAVPVAFVRRDLARLGVEWTPEVFATDKTSAGPPPVMR